MFNSSLYHNAPKKDLVIRLKSNGAVLATRCYKRFDDKALTRCTKLIAMFQKIHGADAISFSTND